MEYSERQRLLEMQRKGYGDVERGCLESPREWGRALDPLSQPLSGVCEEGR